MAFAIRHGVTPPSSPVFVIALEGWIDAGFAAATAASALKEAISAETFATFPPDELIDQRERRPRIHINDGVRGDISWSELELLVGHDQLGSGVALLVGPEPDFRWRPFCAEITALAVEFGSRLVVNLGGFPTASPHTRPVRLAATASNAELAKQVGFVPGSLDVPASIADIIGAEAAAVGIPSVGLWARVPHYVATMVFPAAALALLDGLASVGGLAIATDGLREAADSGLRRVDELIEQSNEHTEMVRQLEAQVDEHEETGFGIGEELPSGDEIAAELERYLRGEEI